MTMLGRRRAALARYRQEALITRLGHSDPPPRVVLVGCQFWCQLVLEFSAPSCSLVRFLCAQSTDSVGSFMVAACCACGVRIKHQPPRGGGCMSQELPQGVPGERLTPLSGRRSKEKLASSAPSLACCERQHAANRTVDKMVLSCPMESVVPV